MLNITDKAAAALSEALSESTDNDSDLLRLAQGEEGLSIEVSDERDDADQIVEYENRPVLAIERRVADALDGSTLDTEDSADGTRLVVRTPEGS